MVHSSSGDREGLAEIIGFIALEFLCDRLKHRSIWRWDCGSLIETVRESGFDFTA